MKSLVEFINESRGFSKLNDNDKLTYDDQLDVKANLNKDLGFTKKLANPGNKYKDRKLGINLSFDSSTGYYELNGEDPNIGFSLDGKITYGEVKQKMIEFYKEHEKELEKDGWLIPDTLKEMIK